MIKKQRFRVPFFFGFRSRILLLFGLVFLVIFGGGFAAFIFGMPFLGIEGEYNRYRTETLQRLSTVADLKKEFLVRWLEERKGDALVIAESELVKDYILKMTRKMKSHDDDRLNTDPLIQYLKNVNKQYGYYERIMIIDNDTGRIFASTDHEDIGRSQSMNNNDREQLAFREFVIRFQYDPKDYDYDLVMLLPIRNRKDPISWGKPEAILSLQIKPDLVARTLPDIGGSLGRTGEVYLIDGYRWNLTKMKYSIFGKRYTAPMSIKLQSKDAVFAAQGEEGIIVTDDYRGVLTLSAFRHVQVTPELGLGIIVKQDAKEAFYYLQQNIKIQIVIFFSFVFMVFILFSTVAKWLFGPVEALSEAAGRIEAGDFQARISYGGRDELGNLVDIFNGMAGRIEQWHKNLEDEVARRTQELFAANAKLVKENAVRKQVEDELRASEERFRRAIVDAPIPIMIHADHGEVLQISKAWTELTGYRQEDIPTVGEWLRKAHGEKNESVQQVINRFYTTHVQNQCGEYDIRTATGEHRTWAFDSALLGKFADGKQMMISIAQDVTERRRAEEALRESEERYRQIVEMSPNAIFIRVDGKIAFINDSGMRLFGVQTKEELIDREVMDLVYEEDRPIVDGRISAHLKDLPIPRLHNEVRLIRPDGKTVWVEASASTLTYRGKPAAQVVLVDVSQRRETERLLKEKIIALTQPLGDVSGIRFEDLFDMEQIQAIQDAFAEATGVAAITADLDGRPLTRPSRFTKLYTDVIRATPQGLADCMQADKLLGQNSPNGPIIRLYPSGLMDGGTNICIGDFPVANWRIGQVVDEEADLERGLSYAREIGADENVFRNEIANVPRMSRQRFEEVCQALFLIAKQLSILAVQNIQQAREIERRYKVEEEIQHLNSELEERVKIRTAQLEASNQELETFSYSVSHDLRAPLRAIEGYGQMLLEDCDEHLSEEGKRYIRTIRKNTQRMAQLIDDLLAFSRMSRKQVDKVPIDMNQLVDGVIEEIRETEPGIKTEFERHNLPPAFGDASMIHQVVFNLINNAVKFSGKKERPFVEIGSLSQDRETVYYIRDNGVGFDMQYVNKLFGVFQRLHGMNEFEGTGVGLAVAGRIISRHDGKIWAEAQVDRGAVFYFTVPGKNQADLEA